MLLHFLASLLAHFHSFFFFHSDTLPTSTSHVRRFSQLPLFIPSFGQPPVLAANIIHFMTPSILSLLGMHDRFTYLFGFWTPMDLDEPEVANFTSKPSSIFFIPLNPYPLICISSLHSHASHILSLFFLPPFSCSPSVSPVPYYVACAIVSWQLFSTIVAY